jgi:hypothetical protein
MAGNIRAHIEALDGAGRSAKTEKEQLEATITAATAQLTTALSQLDPEVAARLTPAIDGATRALRAKVTTSMEQVITALTAEKTRAEQLLNSKS